MPEQASKGNEKHIFALESEFRGIYARGFSFDCSESQLLLQVEVGKVCLNPIWFISFIKGGSGFQI